MGIGEQMERRRRWLFRGVVAGVALVAVPLGYVMGRMAGHGDFDVTAALAGHRTYAIAFVAIYAITMIVGTLLVRQVADEVEVADNLWGSASGYAAYALIFPCWWVLGAAGVTVMPNGWVTFFASMAAALAVYFGRKWAAR